METLVITVVGVLLATLILWLTREVWKYLRPVVPDVRLGTVQRVPPQGEPPPPGYAVVAVEVRLVNQGNRDLHDVTFGIEPKGAMPGFAERSTRRLRAG